MWKEIRWYVLLFAVVFGIAAMHYAYMKSQGYHMEWSGKNFRMIWVDQDGKP
jgi:hypothetical protein